MMRAIHIFPDWGPNAGLEAFRWAYDPLGDIILPHITLVFPFASDLQDAVLTAHAREVAASFGPFRISMGRAESHAPDYIWLPIRLGAEVVHALHEALYKRPLAGFRNQEVNYQPHVTIGRVSHGRRDILREADAVELPTEILVERLVIERIGRDGRSEVLCFLPLGNSPV